MRTASAGALGCGKDVDGGATLGAMDPAIGSVVGGFDERVRALPGRLDGHPVTVAAAALSSDGPGTSAETKLTKRQNCRAAWGMLPLEHSQRTSTGRRRVNTLAKPPRFDYDDRVAAQSRMNPAQ